MSHVVHAAASANNISRQTMNETRANDFRNRLSRSGSEDKIQHRLLFILSPYNTQQHPNTITIANPVPHFAMSRPPKANMPRPSRPGKAPRPAADETSLQDPNASLEPFKQAIVSLTRQLIATPFAPAISSISIALCGSKRSHGAADREVDVYAYAPFNGGNASESFQRLEGYIRNLHSDEKAEFVRIVDRLRGDAGERAGDGGSKLKEVIAQRKALLTERDALLAERDSHIAQLKRQSKQQDADSEDDEAKTAELEALRAKLDKKTQILKDQKALNEALNDEVKIWRDLDSKRSPELLDAADKNDNVKAKASVRGDIDTEDTGVVEDDVDIEGEGNGTTNRDEIDFDDAEVSSDTKDVNDASKLSSDKSSEKSNPSNKPVRGTKSTKPTSTMDPFTFMPKHLAKGKGKSEGEDESDSSKEPPQDVKKGRKTSGLWGNGQASKFQVVADAATPGPSRRQSISAAKAAQSTNDNVNEADDESGMDVEEPHKAPISKKKRKAESSDGEEQPATSKKPKIAPKLPSLEEESDDEETDVCAAKSSRASSRPKAKMSRAQQGAKRKVANDSAESEGADDD
ncbi:hypothetical protein Q7P35_007280 [Cladosporium inversicolor]